MLPVVPEVLIVGQQIAVQLLSFLVMEAIVLLSLELRILRDPKNIYFRAVKVIDDITFDIVIFVDPTLILGV